jgi:DNA-binding transcriptional MocR family regulator
MEAARPLALERKLYEDVAERVALLIEQKTLRPGERIPSVRAMSAQQRVSVSTVLQAYLLLENRGLIETRPQSGHYVRVRARELPAEPRMSRPPTSTTRVTVSDLVARVYGATRDPHIVPLGAAYPSADVLPTERLNRLMAQVARRAGRRAMAYDAPPGCPELRRQIARRALTAGCTIAPDEIVTTSGAMEALHLALRAVADAGDTIAIETPTYYGVLQLIETLGMRALEIPTHPRDGLHLDALETALKQFRVKAVLATPNFNNPLGSLMPDAHKARLVQLLGRREVPLIEDDIYGDLHFGPERPRAARAFDRDGLVLLCASFSKTIAPGYRVGWCAPGRFRERVERLKFMHSVATATLPQMAIAAFLDQGGYDRHLRALRRNLAAQVRRYAEAVSEHFPRGTRLTRPAGGFVLWVELPAGVSALEVHSRALSRGISVAPGPIFSAKQRFANFVRVNCGHPWSDEISRAVATLGRLAAEAAT